MSYAMFQGKPQHGMSAKALRELADASFSKKTPLLTLQQEIAENFYAERADFTVKRHLSDDFAGNLMTSYPLLCRRDMGEQIGTMLRNTNKPWFHMTTADPSREDHEARVWLEWATGLQRRAMYAPSTMFARAASMVDHDFATFGAGVMTVRLNSTADDLLYRCWHLRDVAWLEDEDGKICAIFRRWKPTYYQLCKMFDNTSRPGSSVHPDLKRRADKEPQAECTCYHIMVRADMYDGDARGMPWRSIYYDCDNQHEMQSTPQRNKEYVIPRWLLVSGSQYPHSPATVAALPEARLLQAMTGTLLEAGEKVVNPPMVATEQAVRSDVAIFAGGITWVDREYDEKMGAALRALTQDARGMPLSIEMQKDSRALLMQCFFLNKLTLPQRGPEMTAYEVGQRVQEYIRNALPLFEPMEAEYNGALCEETFDVLFHAGAFGSVIDIPPSLQGNDVHFRFASPLHDAIEQQKGQKFLEMKELLAAAVSMDQNNYAVVDSTEALRDTLAGIGVPTKWTRSAETVKELAQAADMQKQTAAALETMGQGAAVVKDIAQARALEPQVAA